MKKFFVGTQKLNRRFNPVDSGYCYAALEFDEILSLDLRTEIRTYLAGLGQC
jgi:hypothetical protein